MNQKLRKQILFGCLGAAILWASFNMGENGLDQPGKYDLTTIQSLTPGLVGDSVPINVVIDTNRLMLATWGPNPLRSTKKLRRRIAPLLSWKLTGIVFNAAGPLAFVNQKIVKVGDMIDQAKVIKIDKHTVILRYSNEFITLTVSKG